MSKRSIMLDINIVLDLIVHDRPQHEEAMELGRRIAKREVVAYVSAMALATAYYVLRKATHRETALASLELLSHICEIAPQGSDVVARAFHSEEPDFEDALILASAYSLGCDAIVSRDAKAFKGFEGMVFDERGCLEWLA